MSEQPKPSLLEYLEGANRFTLHVGVEEVFTVTTEKQSSSVRRGFPTPDEMKLSLRDYTAAVKLHRKYGSNVANPDVLEEQIVTGLNRVAEKYFQLTKSKLAGVFTADLEPHVLSLSELRKPADLQFVYTFRRVVND